MKEDNKIIFYADLLGYTNYLHNSEEDAIQCLIDAQIISSLSEKIFNDVLFISDSIIGVSNDSYLDDIIKKIATYLADTYRFNRVNTEIDTPEHIKSLDIKTGQYFDCYSYPLLFKSAVGLGCVYTSRDKNNRLYNITGKDFSDVVKLSEASKGSRFYIKDNLYDKLSESIKSRIIRDEKNVNMHYLWSIELIVNVSSNNKPEDICNSFDCLLPTMELLCLHYDDEIKVKDKYIDLFDSFMKSYRIYNIEVGNKLDFALCSMIETLRRYVDRTKYKKNEI